MSNNEIERSVNKIIDTLNLDVHGTDDIDYAWYVGAAGNNKDGNYTDFSQPFIENGIWEHLSDSNDNSIINSVNVGDRIALKSTYIKKHELPFNNNNKPVSVMAIKAIGIVTGNPKNGKSLEVEWKKIDPKKEWYGRSVQRSTIQLVKASDGIFKKALLDFTFKDIPQDYSACEELYADDDAIEFVDEEIINNKEEFTEWIHSLVMNEDEILNSENTADSYINAINNYVITTDDKTIKMFECSDREIVSDEYFKTMEKQKKEGNTGHNRISSAIKYYLRFLDEKYTTDEHYEEYTKDDFLDEVFLSSEEYDKLLNLLKYKKNIILQGAPGVGKTFLAKRFAYSIIGFKNDSYIEFVQFHQNYSYEDLIMGYKPTADGFKLKEGVFYKFCKKAEDDKDHDYFFVIDEINRGNLSKIFGELLMLIESDKRGDDNKVKLAYRNEEFSVPNNLYIIGMMNTADRSIAIMDYALRRRFSFYEVEPAFKNSKFIEHLKTYIKDESIVNKINNRLHELNEKISDEDYSGLGKGFCIGHSYFCVKPVEEQTELQWYSSVLEYEIFPLLEEYWWDDKNKVEECKDLLLKD